MAHAYTIFWTHDRYNTLRRLGWTGRQMEILFGGPHTSEPGFARAGVCPGDLVYPIAVRSGVLHVLGRARVRRMLPLDHYIEQRSDLFDLNHSESLAHTKAFDRYRSVHPAVASLAPTCTDEVVECEESTPLRFDLTIPADLLGRLRYRSQRRERDLSQHLRDGRLIKSLAIQGIYRLSEASACELEALVLGTDIQPRA
ncbi:MAG TPA: hypothetical protein VFV38_39460 [Ktedonobacteraceae bacterium]|nr:hypothetical protein [Ktedonobacteraceae bacterium]